MYILEKREKKRKTLLINIFYVYKCLKEYSLQSHWVYCTCNEESIPHGYLSAIILSKVPILLRTKCFDLYTKLRQFGDASVLNLLMTTHKDEY